MRPIKIARIILVLVATFPTAHSKILLATPRPESPLSKIHNVSLYTSVGGTMEGLIEYETLPIFDSPRGRLLESAMEQRLEETLGEAGISVDPASDDEVGVRIWGHQDLIKESGPVHVFYISLGIDKHNAYPEAPCDKDFSTRLVAVGVAQDDELEEKILHHMTRLLENVFY